MTYFLLESMYFKIHHAEIDSIHQTIIIYYAKELNNIQTINAIENKDFIKYFLMQQKLLAVTYILDDNIIA